MKKILIFNDSKNSDKRILSNRLSIKNEYKIIEIINKRINKGQYDDLSHFDFLLLQRFINNYENMCHYISYTKKINKNDN